MTHNPGLNTYSLDPDDELGLSSDRDEDIAQALKCLEEALNTLAMMGTAADVELVTELLNRAYQYLDRDYSEQQEPACFEELDFEEDRLRLSDEDQERW